MPSRTWDSWLKYLHKIGVLWTLLSFLETGLVSMCLSSHLNNVLHWSTTARSMTIMTLVCCAPSLCYPKGSGTAIFPKKIHSLFNAYDVFLFIAHRANASFSTKLYFRTIESNSAWADFIWFWFWFLGKRQSICSWTTASQTTSQRLSITI